MAEETSQDSMLMSWLGAAAKGGGSGSTGGILLSLVHLLLELLGLLLVDKAQASEAFFELKGVEEGSVLVVGPRIEDLLVPNDAAIGRRDINQLDPVSVADKVVAEHNGSLQASICPFRAIGIGNVESRNGHSLDLV